MCLAVATVMLALLTFGVGTAAGQTSFQSSYRAYGAWDEGNSALPDKCTQTQPVYGSEPAAPGRYPVLVYLHGTLADWGNNVEGQRVAQFAARQGFVTAAFTYESWVVNAVSGIDGNARCMFSPGSSGNALASLCARPKADCSRGVAVAGFSAGGAIAARARNFAPQVRAAWLLGVNGPAIPEAVAAPAGQPGAAQQPGPDRRGPIRSRRSQRVERVDRVELHDIALRPAEPIRLLRRAEFCGRGRGGGPLLVAERKPHGADEQLYMEPDVRSGIHATEQSAGVTDDEPQLAPGLPRLTRLRSTKRRYVTSPRA